MVNAVVVGIDTGFPCHDTVVAAVDGGDGDRERSVSSAFLDPLLDTCDVTGAERVGHDGVAGSPDDWCAVGDDLSDLVGDRSSGCSCEHAAEAPAYEIDRVAVKFAKLLDLHYQLVLRRLEMTGLVVSQTPAVGVVSNCREVSAKWGHGEAVRSNTRNMDV